MHRIFTETRTCAVAQDPVNGWRFGTPHFQERCEHSATAQTLQWDSVLPRPAEVTKRARGYRGAFQEAEETVSPRPDPVTQQHSHPFQRRQQHRGRQEARRRGQGHGDVYLSQVFVGLLLCRLLWLEGNVCSDKSVDEWTHFHSKWKLRQGFSISFVLPFSTLMERLFLKLLECDQIGVHFGQWRVKSLEVVLEWK